MNLESDDTDSDNDILFDDVNSTGGSEHGKISENLFTEHQKKPSNTRKSTFKKN
jgi:hypothetical protein